MALLYLEIFFKLLKISNKSYITQFGVWTKMICPRKVEGRIFNTLRAAPLNFVTFKSTQWPLMTSSLILIDYTLS